MDQNPPHSSPPPVPPAPTESNAPLYLGVVVVGALVLILVLAAAVMSGAGSGSSSGTTPSPVDTASVSYRYGNNHGFMDFVAGHPSTRYTDDQARTQCQAYLNRDAVAQTDIDWLGGCIEGEKGHQ